MNILADIDLPHLSHLFPKPFQVTTYQSQQELLTHLPFADILICRSTLRVTKNLLKHSRVQCVATASSGTDHIDQEYLRDHDISLFDAKGCNAHAVADYVSSTVAWLETQQFVTGKHVGIIGVGMVGSKVMKRLSLAGYDVVGYDPYQTTLDSSGILVHALNELSHCDILCIHANLHHNNPHPSVNLINADFLSILKPGVSLINASRGGIVNETDLLSVPQPIHYCTDVYWNEPDIHSDIVHFSTLCTPHIAGHSIEAKQNAVIQLSIQLHQHFHLQAPQTLGADSSHDALHFNPSLDLILKHYNPYHETQILKQSPNKKEAFLTQRRSHVHRHDFRAPLYGIF